MKKIIFLFIFISVSFLVACKKSSTTNNTVTCSGVSAKFSTDASPVISNKCATNSGCHGAGASNSGGVLTDYNSISSRASNIKAAIVNGSMPRGSSLSTSEKQAIVCWIDNGALNN